MKLLSVFSVGAERAVMITVAPPCWKRSAIALPAPFVPPVTKTRLPANSFASRGVFDDVVILFYLPFLSCGLAIYLVRGVQLDAFPFVLRFIVRFALLEKRAIS